MAKEEKKGITSKKKENFADWYPEVVVKAELADYSAVKGAMVIRPNAFAVWEKIQAYFNPVMKKYGVKNAYFPLFVPESFFKREAKHVEGFAPEVAWIETKGEERLAVRPTSETIIADSFSQWIRSWRDLPLKINQWANIVRWETKQTRLFLRTREFLWQEGHCVYETEEECAKEVKTYMDEYVRLCSELLAIPVVSGEKTEKEKFPGAKASLTMEALMPDGRAVQMGTSHNLGQGFMEVFNVKYLGKDEKPHTPWSNSWGISTRLIGAAIMTHGDDKGMVMPPKVAPIQVAIVPIIFEQSKKEVLEASKKLKDDLEAHNFSVVLDDRNEYSPGWKFNNWELKGVPVRIELGPKDLEKQEVVLVRRDTSEKHSAKIANVKDKVKDLLETMHKDMFEKAKKFLLSNIIEVNSMEDFIAKIKERKMVLAPFCGTPACEDEIKTKADGATSRCISDKRMPENAKCVCGKDAKFLVYFAKGY